MAMMTVAQNMLPQPWARPRFQPEKWPEITAPTPNAHSDHDARIAAQAASLEVARVDFGVLDARRF